MNEDFKHPFYTSSLWKDCRESYAKSVGYLCENCLRNGVYQAGDIVHHKIHINESNINNPDITTNFDNLELLCRSCHAKEHTKSNKRYKIDDLGRVIVL